MLCSKLWNGIVGTVFSYSFLFFLCQFVADSILFQVASALSIWFQLIPGGPSLFQLFPRFSMDDLVPVSYIRKGKEGFSDNVLLQNGPWWQLLKPILRVSNLLRACNLIIKKNNQKFEHNNSKTMMANRCYFRH